MLDIAAELKSRITITDVISRYWEDPGNYNRVRCFAHNGADKNMLVRNGLAYCFVCGEKFDIISAVQKLFELDFMSACMKLNIDFALNLPIGRKLSAAEYRELKKAEQLRAEKKRAEIIRADAEHNIFIRVCDQLRRVEAWLKRMEPSEPMNASEFWLDMYFRALEQRELLEWLADALTGTIRECAFSKLYPTAKTELYDALLSGKIVFDKPVTMVYNLYSI